MGKKTVTRPEIVSVRFSVQELERLRKQAEREDRDVSTTIRILTLRMLDVVAIR